MADSHENIALEPTPASDDNIQVGFAPEPANGDNRTEEDAGIEEAEPSSSANDFTEESPEEFKRDQETGESPFKEDLTDHGATIDIDHDQMDEEKRTRERNCVFFEEDGQKLRIDYVLVYREDDKRPDRVDTREIFQQHLREYDIVVYESPDVDITDDSLHYILLHAPWDTLTTGAELIGLKKRLKMPKTLEKKVEKLNKANCADGCRTSQQYIADEGEFFTAQFHVKSMDMFEIGDTDKFFSNAERSLIVQEILARTSFTPDDSTEMRFGVSRLVSEGVYHAAYPMHDGPYLPVSGVVCEEAFDGEDTERMLLYETWARTARCCCYQPLDLIRRYFGEKIGLYFAWLGFYTQMLIPASLFGLGAFIYGLVTMFQDPIGNDICEDKNVSQYTMCPQCSLRCDYWELKESCIYSRITYLFDNYSTIVFTFLMTVWGTFFLEFWKRKQAELQYEWDVQDFENQERMRPEFEFKVRKRKENPITKVPEPYLTKLNWCCRAFTSMTVACFFVLLVVGTILGVVVYRFVVVALLYSAPIAFVSTWAKIITSITASCINLIIIMILSQVYRRVAYSLTEMELHRTETDFEDAYIFKMFIFQFANFYGTTFYIAFFKGKFQAVPGAKDYYLFGRYEPDVCDPSGCMIDLLIQLFIVMVGKQAINQVKEIIIPKLCVWRKQNQAKKDERSGGVYTRWMQDQDMQNIDRLTLFEEYLEMVIQYGFVTIFVAAFPLAPVFALLNNIIEIRVDAYKFVTQFKRPNANRAQDIGVWYSIMETITYIAILTNSVIIAWTSEFIPRMVYLFVYSKDRSLHGYVDDSLSYFSTNDYSNGTAPDEPSAQYENLGMCRYKGYFRPPNDPADPYGYTPEFWHVIVARLAFVLVFEHACLLIKYMIAYIIPDVSADVKRLIAYEKSLNRHLMFKSTMEEKKETKKHQSASMDMTY